MRGVKKIETFRWCMVSKQCEYSIRITYTPGGGLPRN